MSEWTPTDATLAGQALLAVALVVAVALTGLVMRCDPHPDSPAAELMEEAP